MLRVVRAGTHEASQLLVRSTRFDAELDSAVGKILDDVRRRGDDAVADYTRRFDHREPPYELLADRRRERAAQVSPDVRAALEFAASRIRAFHARQVEPDLEVIDAGVRLELRVSALARAGLYVPGGTARYPSSVLMTAIPAKVAGVRELVMVTPGASPETLLAAELAGVDRVFEIGGAQAVGALAYGTQTVPRVDKIVGPGNAFVNEAKLIVSHDVAIDLPAGPSEVVVVLGRGGDARIAELELAAQAEHGPDAVCRIVEGDDLETALAEVERIAPEHVVLLGEAESLAPRIRNAGAVFVGASSPVASGDYATGGNHVLPTGGWARSVGGLGLETFLKPVTVQRLTAAGLDLVRPTVEALAAVEGMSAHAAAVQR
jgi:histidinol dehydrogenase